jgi:hypothetical protein
MRRNGEVDMQQQVVDVSPLAEPYRGRFRSAKVPSCLLNREDLQRLYNELDARTVEALDRHIAGFQRQPNVSEESFNETRQRLRSSARLTVTIHSRDGEQIVSRSVAALSNESLPDRITLLNFDSAAALQLINQTPLNRFYVRLDFTEPPGFDNYNPWSQPTPNTSQFEIIGNDQMWVTGVYESVISFFQTRRRRRGWLHTQRTFNIAHWLVGFPAALWMTYRVSYYVPALARLHPALSGAIYTYAFLLGLLVFRGIVLGFRWLFPVIELDGSRSKAVRNVLTVILSFLLLALLYDVLKGLLSF